MIIDGVKNIKSVLDSMGVNAPILRIIIINPINMTDLYEICKNASEESLKSIRKDYAIFSLNNENNFSVIFLQDILYKDINDPNSNNTIYHIEMKRNLQAMEKHRPDLVNTFFYKDKNIDELEEKIYRGIKLALNQFKKDIMMISYDYIHSCTTGLNKASNTYMQGIVDKVIHEKFCVINEICDNEFSNKYVVIKEKEKQEDDNDAN